LPHTFALIAAVVMLAVLVVAALIAIAHRLPLWAYPWMAVDAIGLMVVLNLAAEDRAFVFSPTADIVVLVLFFLASLTTLGTAALRGWQRTGLLSVGFSATMGLSLCFWAIAGPFRSDLGLLTAPLGLLMAALTYAYVRGSDSVRIAVLLSIGLTNTGLTWAVDRVFRSWDLFPDESSLLWPLLAFSTGPLLGGPLLGLLGQRLHLAFQRKRRRVVG
jgi:hypothetical protein